MWHVHTRGVIALWIAQFGTFWQLALREKLPCKQSPKQVANNKQLQFCNIAIFEALRANNLLNIKWRVIQNSRTFKLKEDHIFLGRKTSNSCQKSSSLKGISLFLLIYVMGHLPVRLEVKLRKLLLRNCELFWHKIALRIALQIFQGNHTPDYRCGTKTKRCHSECWQALI